MEENPFQYSTIVDVFYHGTNKDFVKISINNTVDGGIHIGTLAQANMRSAGVNKRILEVFVDIRKPRRSKDAGGNWKSKIASAKKSGFDSIVYLNRYEGISLESIQKAENFNINLDAISDAEFKQIVPEAQDSYIVFSDSQIRLLSECSNRSKLSKISMRP